MEKTNLIEQMLQYFESLKLPPMIILDITNKCNLKCVHCPQPIIQAKSDFKPQFMSWENFIKIVDEIASINQPCLLRFVGDGEPLIHPQILSMIEYAKDNCQAVINLTTNGLLLSPEKVKNLLSNSIHLIDISVDALTKPVYEIIRKGGSYEKLLYNIFFLLKERKKQSASTKVVVSFIEQKDNSDQVQAFRNFWRPLVDHVMIRSIHSAGGLVKKDESRSKNKAESIIRYPCPHLWKRLTVDFSGAIKFCAHDWGSGAILGNIDKDCLADIWKSKFLKNLRNQHLKGKIDDDFYCSKCYDWASSKWDWGYERLIDKIVFGNPTLIPFLPPLT